MPATSNATLNRPTIHQATQFRNVIVRFTDALSIGIGLQLTLQILPTVDSKATIVSALVAFAVFSLVAELFGLYRDWSTVAFGRETGCSVLSWASTLIALSTLGYFSIYTTEFSSSALLVWFMITPVVALGFRVSARSLHRLINRKGINTKKYAIIGCNRLGVQLSEAMNQSQSFNLSFQGYYDDRSADRLLEEHEEELPTILGDLEQLIADAKKNDIEVVFVTLPMKAESRIRKILSQLSDSTISVYLVPDLFVYQLMHSRWTTVEGLPVVSVFENPFYGVDGALKRAVDLVAGLLILAAVSIPMLCVAIAVKLTSKGPVFFRQKRYGLDGKSFLVWKFRSMTVCENGNKVTQAKKNDSRLTSIGGFLRKTSLDELPQLFNVLGGTMSLVGPRPHANAHNEYYRSQISGYMLRHKVKPGITGLAQVNGFRGETDTIEKMEKRIECDHQYIREWSIWMDLNILIKTVRVVMERENAY